MSATSPSIVVIGTLDTKAAELGFLREQLEARGMRTVLVDVGTAGSPGLAPDVDRHEVASATGIDVDREAGAGERGGAVAAMAEAAAATVQRLRAEGRCDGIVGAGGGSNTTIVSAAMRALPLGVPKIMVSTLAGAAGTQFVGASDLILMPSVADVAGLNSLIAPTLARAAAAVAAMVGVASPESSGSRQRIAATMFGVTTPCVDAARQELEEQGFEVVVFHAVGTGGRAMESLVRNGFFAATLDATTTEVADEVVGGVLSGGPGRLTAAGDLGLPQVVSLGALDIVNFGAPETVPEQFAGRRLSVHHAHATLMRANPEESERIGAHLARKLSAARGPVAVFVPLRGVSALSAEGGNFHDPQPDQALFRGLRENLGETVELHELDTHINDPEFAHAMAARLAEYLKKEQG